MFPSLDTNAELRKVDAVIGVLRSCLLSRASSETMENTAYSKTHEYHNSVMKDMCSKYWRCFFFFFSSLSLMVESQKSRIDLLSEPGKESLFLRNFCENDGNCRAKSRWQNTGGLPYDFNCKGGLKDIHINKNTGFISPKVASTRATCFEGQFTAHFLICL